MQAYLTDLAWQDQLFVNARKTARSPGTARDESQREEPSAESERARDHVYAPIGARWAVAGNPFMRVELTDLGLVQVNALWTAESLPAHGQEITKPFRSVLRSLDGSSIEE
jgi:hypothetical protein